jgi:hypothetical protein
VGHLTPDKLDELIAAGCTACGGKRLTFETYVDAKQPLHEGEPVGKLSWAYDGEAFCDGVYEVRCASCSQKVFEESACPRCHAADGLPKALESENDWPPPRQCPRCEGIEVMFFAMVPATTHYESKRADKATTDTALLDPGFHGYKATCKHCGVVAELKDRCMLCGARGPLRDRA